ncbi:hypothetical protein BROUX41_000901 [Berkeleyomyces rouxiae]|uniref:uncharacterized protein n=1 Tax=Berkeleyomyces rouxiae TaxID=2035830 RepID=UPI003B8006C7
MAVTNLQSSSQWDAILKTHNVVIADFYADWCGPCKMIAPKFEALAREYAQPKKVAFVKVNVDVQRDVAAAQNVRAMPTFKLFHRGKVLDTVQGANPSALAAAITSALLLKDKGSPGEIFSTPGQRLGGVGVDDGKHAGARTVAGSRLGGLSPIGLLKNMIMMIGLYLVSLLTARIITFPSGLALRQSLRQHPYCPMFANSYNAPFRCPLTHIQLDPYKSAQMSRFNTVSPPETVTVKTQAADGSTITKKVVRPAFKTLADL